MQFTLFIAAAYFMGCMAAVPAGPVQIEVVRRSVNGHLKPSLAVVLGAFFIDVLYGVIAFFGIAPFLEEKKVLAIFWLFGGLLLCVLGILAIRHSSRNEDISRNNAYLKKKRWAFLGGLSLSATNPVMILWWLSGARIFKDLGLIKEFTSGMAVSFLIAGSFGLASYLVALAFFIYWAKKFISYERLRQINLAFGVLLLVLAAYFIYTSLHTMLTVN